MLHLMFIIRIIKWGMDVVSSTLVWFTILLGFGTISATGKEISDFYKTTLPSKDDGKQTTVSLASNTSYLVVWNQNKL